MMLRQVIFFNHMMSRNHLLLPLNMEFVTEKLIVSHLKQEKVIAVETVLLNSTSLS